MKMVRSFLAAVAALAADSTATAGTIDTTPRNAGRAPSAVTASTSAPRHYYELAPVEERPAKRIPCAIALRSEPLSRGKRGVDETRGFGEVFGRIIETSDCKRDDILAYMNNIGAKKEKPEFVWEGGSTHYFYVNTYKRPWYLFWSSEYGVALAFDGQGNLLFSNWSTNKL